MKKMNNALSHCQVCPRKCGIDRTAGKTGFCRASYLPKVALVSRHDWEEPPISGTKGSGTVFFSHCNLGCVFCQNHDISQDGYGQEISVERLAEIFLEQQERGFHNVNLVSAVQFIPQAAKALEIAREKGLSIPVVYNSNGYESREGLKMLERLVDVYLPDFKYVSAELAGAYSAAPDYAEVATAALAEMHRQTGAACFDADGLMTRGLVVRHLVLPGSRVDSMAVLDRIAETVPVGDVRLSLMRQYTPDFAPRSGPKSLLRRVKSFEYESVMQHAVELGFEGYFQQKESADKAYTPDFAKREILR